MHPIMLEVKRLKHIRNLYDQAVLLVIPGMEHAFSFNYIYAMQGASVDITELWLRGGGSRALYACKDSILITS